MPFEVRQAGTFLKNAVYFGIVVAGYYSAESRHAAETRRVQGRNLGNLFGRNSLVF
jgi:hypothetical protein